MKNLSNKKIPVKYRHLQKEIDAINQFLDGLPQPSADYSLFPPYERDLAETFNGCLVLAARQQFQDEEIRGYSNIIVKSDMNLIKTIFLEFYNEEQFKIASKLFNSAPQSIQVKNQSFWAREAAPNLLAFLKNQQKSYTWLPKGFINHKSLTWVAWDELLTLLKRKGYDSDKDDVRMVSPIDHWSNAEKRKIIHLYLEMIQNEKLTDIFNSRIDNPQNKYILRKRLYFFAR